MEKAYDQQCYAAFEKRTEYKGEFRGELDYHWKGFKRYYKFEGAHKVMVTGVKQSVLKELGALHCCVSSTLLTGARRSPRHAAV
jgi:hypothetical protein